MSTARRNPMSVLKSRVQKQKMSKASSTKEADKSKTQGILYSEKRSNEKSTSNMDLNNDKVSTSCGSFTAAKKMIIKRNKKSKSTSETKQVIPPVPAAPLGVPTSSPPQLKEKRSSSSIYSDRGNGSSNSNGSLKSTGSQQAPSEKFDETDDNSYSPTEEDVFMDARSNLSSDDDDDYKTPLTSRSPSLSCLLSPSLSQTAPSSSTTSSVTTLDGYAETPTFNELNILLDTTTSLSLTDNNSTNSSTSRSCISTNLSTNDLSLKPSDEEACQGAENDSGVEEPHSLDSSITSGCPESSVDSNIDASNVSFFVGDILCTDQSSAPVGHKELTIPPCSILHSGSSRSSSFESMNLASPVSPTCCTNLSLPPRTSLSHSPSPPTPTRTRSSRNIVINTSPKRSKLRKSSKDSRSKSKSLSESEAMVQSNNQASPVGVVCNKVTASENKGFNDTAHITYNGQSLPSNMEGCGHDNGNYETNFSDSVKSIDCGIDSTDHNDQDINDGDDGANCVFDGEGDGNIMLPLSRHPLQSTWILYYDKLTSGRPQFNDYEASLHPVAPIATVEDFWGVYNNLMLPSELDKNANYHIFKQGIKPLWEHKDNRHGGKWVLTFRNTCSSSDKLDKAWMEVLLALIGEHIQKSFLITGAVVSRRKKGDRIAIWTKMKKNTTGNLEICKHLLHVLSLAFDVPDSQYSQFVQDLAEERNGLTLVYMHHEDAMKTGTSYQNEARLTVKHNLQFLMTKP